MNLPLELSFRGMEITDDLENLIREKAAKLDQFYSNISSCRVAVEKTQRHQSTGNPYRVRIDITIPPGHEIIIKREASTGDLHTPLSSVIRDSFSSAYRQVKELVEKKRKCVKDHPLQEMNGIIEKIHKDEGFGFIKSIDNKQIYFHKNSVINDVFADLKIGDGVHFFEEIGENGTQASSVHLVNRSNY